MTELPPQFFETATPRFVLRTLQPGDAHPELEAWTLDPLVAGMMNAEQKAWSLERQRALFTEGLVRANRRNIGLFPAGSQIPIGLIIIRLNPAQQTFVISIMIGDKAWRGKNVAGECSNAILGKLFLEHGFHKAKANILPANKAMIWLLAHSAWKREGRLVGHLRNTSTGGRQDVLVYGLLKPAWQNFMKQNQPVSSFPPQGAPG